VREQGRQPRVLRRHPERGGHTIRPEERALAKEWIEIRDTVVRPTIERLSRVRPTSDPEPAIPPGAAQLGMSGSIRMKCVSFKIEGSPERA
jgi:hypothetical protein